MKPTHVILFLALVAVSSCQPKPAAEPASPAFDAQAFATRYFDTFNAHDWVKLSEMYAQPAEFLDPSFGLEAVPQSRAQFVAKYTELQKLFPDIRDSLTRVVAGGDHVAVEFVSTGTGPDGKPFKLPIAAVLTLKDGLITSDHTYYDNP